MRDMIFCGGVIFVEQYRISGGNKLVGEYELTGAKNAVLPILAATIITGNKSKIKSCPDLSDVRNNGMLRINQDGMPEAISPLGDSEPLNLYYSYGVRNSFGFDFDPITGKLWNTENGEDFGDEINLVEPGFNLFLLSRYDIGTLV